MSDPTEWSWVPSECNPADHATKPKIGSLHKNHQWFNGPEFLGREKEHWPSQDCLKMNNHPTDLPTELRKVNSVLITKLARPDLPNPKRFSKFNRLLRSTAWTLVAIDKMRYRIESKMTTEYLSKAKTLLLREIQNDCFKSEIIALSRQEPIENRSRIKALTPSIGKNGLLRVRGRVNVPNKLDFEGQPIIIDSAHQITRLILQEYHEKANHGSDNTVLNEIRQKFWVVSARKSLRSISAKCQFCILTRKKPVVPMMADLLEGRVAYQQRPFTHCGVDYFGPMIVKIGRRREKRWGALFTCLTTRAIHIELAHTSNKDSAIMALRRLNCAEFC